MQTFIEIDRWKSLFIQLCPKIHALRVHNGSEVTPNESRLRNSLTDCRKR